MSMVDNIEDNITIKTPEPVPAKNERKKREPKANNQIKETKIKQKKQRTELSIKEKAFCREYAKHGVGSTAVQKAGYKTSSINSASTIGNRLLKKVEIQAEITRLTGAKEKKAIMDAQEVMELFSAIARGEIKDQFGLDASLNDRLKAMNEIAKRTVDIENRMKGIPDSNVSIKLDWTD